MTRQHRSQPRQPPTHAMSTDNAHGRSNPHPGSATRRPHLAGGRACAEDEQQHGQRARGARHAAASDAAVRAGPGGRRRGLMSTEDDSSKDRAVARGAGRRRALRRAAHRNGDTKTGPRAPGVVRQVPLPAPPSLPAKHTRRPWRRWAWRATATGARAGRTCSAQSRRSCWTATSSLRSQRGHLRGLCAEPRVPCYA